MKNKQFEFKKVIILLLNILKYAVYLLIAYIVIWGLIIEPHLPQHYYGVTDLIELIEAFLLLIPIRCINSIIGFSHIVQYFGSELNQKQFSVTKCIKKFGKRYKIRKTIVFNESFTNFVENMKCIYLITGLTNGIKLGKAYCFGWSFNENEKDIDLYQLIYTKDKPVYHKFSTVPAESKCVFNIEYKDRLILKWKMYIQEGNKLNLIYDDELMTPKQSRWGINLDCFENCLLKDGNKEINTHKISKELINL